MLSHLHILPFTRRNIYNVWFNIHHTFTTTSTLNTNNTFNNDEFVSKYKAPPSSEMTAVLTELESKSSIRKSSDGNIEVKECHFCDKGNRSDAGNLWKLKYVFTFTFN